MKADWEIKTLDAKKRDNTHKKGRQSVLFYIKHGGVL